MCVDVEQYLISVSFMMETGQESLGVRQKDEWDDKMDKRKQGQSEGGSMKNTAQKQTCTWGHKKGGGQEKRWF